MKNSASQHTKLEDQVPFLYLMSTYIGYLIILAFGHSRDYFGTKFNKKKYQHLTAQNVSEPLAIFYLFSTLAKCI